MEGKGWLGTRLRGFLPMTLPRGLGRGLVASEPWRWLMRQAVIPGVDGRLPIIGD